MKISPAIRDNKIIIVGNSGAGKTSIIRQFTEREFIDQTEGTIGAAHVTFINKTESGVTAALSIWDTAGQEKFRSLIPMYSRNALAAIIVTDLTSIESYNDRESWYDAVLKLCPPECKIYLVANKVDLEAAFPIENMYQWAAEKNLPFFVTSAKMRDTIVPLFDLITEEVEKSPKDVRDTGPVVRTNIYPNEDTAECC